MKHTNTPSSHPDLLHIQHSVAYCIHYYLFTTSSSPQKAPFSTLFAALQEQQNTRGHFFHPFTASQKRQFRFFHHRSCPSVTQCYKFCTRTDRDLVISIISCPSLSSSVRVYHLKSMSLTLHLTRTYRKISQGFLLLKLDILPPSIVCFLLHLTYLYCNP